MRFHRKNALLNDAIEVLDQRLKEAKGNTLEAWTRLSSVELEFVTGEIAQCIASRRYYLESFHCIATERGELMGLSPLWDHQVQIEEALQKELDLKGWAKIIALKGRQTGGSEYANGVMCWATFFTPFAYTMTVAQAPDVSAHMQRKVLIAHRNLPWWLRPSLKYSTKGEYLEFANEDKDARLTGDPGMGSVFVTTHAQRSSGVAIGRTIRFLHLTEISRWPSGEIYSADIEPSMNAPDTIAIAESTALGDSNFFHNLWQEAVDGESDWTPVFLPAYRAKKFSLPIDPRQRPFILTASETAVRERVLEEETFVVPDEFFNWRRRRIKSAIKRTGYPYAHYESYPITAKEAFQSSGFGVFPRHKMDEQQNVCVRRPKWIGEIVYQGMNAKPKLLVTLVSPDTPLEKREFANRFYIWEMPEPNASYYSGVDVGGGNLGDDLSVQQVLRAGSGVSPDVQVAEWVGYAQPVEFAKINYSIGFLFNKCEIAVEYAKEGITTSNFLANDLEYPNLYRPRSRDRIGKQLANFLHWQTTGKTKVLLKATMSETLLENGIVIRSQYALNEMYKCVRLSSGGWGVPSPGHDDSAVGLCIALFCLRETLAELRAPQQNDDASNLSPSTSARITGGGMLYGIYDKFFRMIGQTRDLQKAMDTIAANPGLQIKPIVISKANTAYSPIYHGRGAEHQMFKEGMDSRDVTPQLVTLWKERMGEQGKALGSLPSPRMPAGYASDNWDDLAAGDDMGWSSEGF